MGRQECSSGFASYWQRQVGEGVPRGSIERLITRIQVVLSCVNLLLECVVLRLGLRGGAIEGVDRLIDNPAEELDEDLPGGRAGGSQVQAQGQTKGSVAPAQGVNPRGGARVSGAETEGGGCLPKN